MERLIGTRRSLSKVVGSVALFALLVVPIAVAGSSHDPQATASAGVKKKVKALTKQVNELQQRLTGLEGQLAALQGQQDSSGPPSGPAGGDLTGVYPNPSIANDAVDSAKVANDSLGFADIGTDAVGFSELADSAVDTFSIQPDAVDLVAMQDNSVSAPEVTNGSLGTQELANSIPAVHVTHSASQSVPEDSNPKLAFDSERYDTANMHSTSTNNTRLTAPVTGIYAVTVQLDWSATVGTGSRFIRLIKNNAQDIGATTYQGTGGPAQEVTTQVRLQTGDFVEVLVDHSVGTETLNILQNSERSPEFSMTWLAPGP